MRLKTSVVEARGVHAKGDIKGFKNRMMGVRRVKLQMDRIDTSIEKIEINMDEIINSDVTKDIIESLKKSTVAMRAGMVGGIDGVQETMDDLQVELQVSQDVTDAIYNGLSQNDGGLDDETSLVEELNSFLRDNGEEEAVVAVEVTTHSVDLAKFPSTPVPRKRAVAFAQEEELPLSV